MTFLSVLFALGLERLLGHLPGFGQPLLLGHAVRHAARPAPQWLQDSSRSALAPVVFLALCVLTVWLVDRWLEHPLVHLLFMTAVLLLCLGPRDLADDVKALLQARADGDERRSALLQRVLLQGPDRRVASRRSFIGALFIQSHERVIGVLLWFFVLGPAGAVLYRIASRMPRFLHERLEGSGAEDMSVTLHALCAWPSARLSAVLFALAGSTDAALAAWRSLPAPPELNWRHTTWAVLSEVPAAALSVQAEDGDGPAVPADLDECLREVLRMQTRALLILVAAFGVFTAGGWMA
jgi:membrane protein required for beta-lactamase induction